MSRKYWSVSLSPGALHEYARTIHGDRAGSLVRCPSCGVVVTERDRARHAGSCVKLLDSFQLAYPEQHRAAQEAAERDRPRHGSRRSEASKKRNRELHGRAGRRMRELNARPMRTMGERKTAMKNGSKKAVDK